MSGWGWLLLILVLIALAVLIWWWWKRRAAAAAAPSAAVKTAAPAPGPMAPEPVAADDLTIIEGIGPKVSSVLKDAGIKTLAQLSVTNVSKLQDILKAAGFRYMDPASWPEQARLAAEGKVAELKTLQDQLKGGRRA